MSSWLFSGQDPWKGVEKLSRSGSELPFVRAPMSPAGTDTIPAEHQRKQGEDLAPFLLCDGPASDQESELLLS